MKDEGTKRINAKSFFDDTMPVDGIYQSCELIFIVKRCIRDLKSKIKVKKHKKIRDVSNGKRLYGN